MQTMIPVRLFRAAIIMTVCASVIACSGCRAPLYHAAAPKPLVRISNLEIRVHALINAERRKNGLSTLVWDDALAAIARSHSNDMARRNYFDHVSPEGHDFSQRYRQAAYSCARRSERTVYEGAENIALNHLYDSVTTVNGEAYYDWNDEEKLAQTTVQGWMNSPGHRKNILTPAYQHEGIGVVISPGGNVYITENFC